MLKIKTTLQRRHWWLILVAVVLLVILIAVLVKKRAATADAALATRPPTALEFLSSDVTVIRQGDLRKTLPLSGALRAVNLAVIKAKLGAEVREVLVREGETVKVGQVLVRMDGSEYQAKLDQARGALQAAQGQLDIATQTRNNNKALLAKNFISKNAFDNAQSQYQIAVSNVKSARGAFDVAQKALNDTVIRAPIAGQISIRAVQPGEKVSTDNKLLEIVDLKKMEMEAAVPAADIASVAAGQEVQLQIEGLPDMIPGKVTRINPAIQTGSRSILVYIQVDNPQGLMKMGMFAEAKLTLTRRNAVLSVPETAVRTEAGKSVVYAIENEKLSAKVVTVGIAGDDGDGSAVEIINGLEKGATVVKLNLGNLLDGTPVRLVAPTVAPASSAPASASASAPVVSSANSSPPSASSSSTAGSASAAATTGK